MQAAQSRCQIQHGVDLLVSVDISCALRFRLDFSFGHPFSIMLLLLLMSGLCEGHVMHGMRFCLFHCMMSRDFKIHGLSTKSFAINGHMLDSRTSTYFCDFRFSSSSTGTSVPTPQYDTQPQNTKHEGDHSDFHGRMQHTFRLFFATHRVPVFSQHNLVSRLKTSLFSSKHLP